MKLGRNDPCHCGSGNKYKKCCEEKDQAARSAELAAQQAARAAQAAAAAAEAGEGGEGEATPAGTTTRPPRGGPPTGPQRPKPGPTSVPSMGRKRAI